LWTWGPFIPKAVRSLIRKEKKGREKKRRIPRVRWYRVRKLSAHFFFLGGKKKGKGRGKKKKEREMRPFISRQSMPCNCYHTRSEKKGKKRKKKGKGWGGGQSGVF